MNTVLLRLLLAFILIVSSAPPSWSTPSSATAAQAEVAARLTESKGTVYKRGFIDWERQQWGEPLPAKVGDELNEGMQVGTGNNSWAQISWSHIKTRAWSNSVYAIAPNQRLVYLVGGEMLFQLDKKRKDKSEYHIWTNLIHARIRGTTVLMQSTGDVSRVTVMEGHIDVINRTDNSVVHLKPGAVYEIKANDAQQAGPSGTDVSNDAAQVITKPAPTAVLSDLTKIMAIDTARPVFETRQTTSTLYLADKQALLSHPLLTSFETPLPSLPLINDVLGSLGLPDLISNLLPSTLKEILGQAFDIAQVPSRLNYRLGADAGGLIPINRQSVGLLPPDGFLGSPTGVVNSLAARPLSGIVTQVTPLSNLSGLNVGASTSAALSSVSALTGATGSLSSLSALTGNTAALGSVTSSTASLGAVTSATTGALNTLPTVTTSALGGVTGLVNGTVGTVRNVVTPLLGGGGGGGGGGGLLGLPLGGGGGLGGLLGH